MSDYTIDLEWDEDRPGGARNPYNLVSIPVTDRFYKSTARALPWTLAGDRDPGRAAVPSAFLENILRRAPAGDDEAFKDYRFVNSLWASPRSFSPL